MNSAKLSGPTQEIIKREQICQWVQQLGDPATRGNALIELNKRREVIPDLGMILWHSFGTVAALIQEIVNVFPNFNPLTLTMQQSHRLCNVLYLLKSVASHPETKTMFAQAQIPIFIHPFLKLYRGRTFENIRIASLRVLEALVKNDSEEATRYFLSTDAILHVLDIMEKDSRPGKTIALSILQSITSNEDGLMRLCETFERFSRVTTALGNVVRELAKDATRWADESKHVGVLLNHVVQCYLRLSQNGRAREALRRAVPLHLKDGTFSQFINEDLSTKSALTQLLNNLGLCPFVFEIQSID